MDKQMLELDEKAQSIVSFINAQKDNVASIPSVHGHICGKYHCGKLDVNGIIAYLVYMGEVKVVSDRYLTYIGHLKKKGCCD